MQKVGVIENTGDRVFSQSSSLAAITPQVMILLAKEGMEHLPPVYSVWISS
jgi:hypothetical protein